MAARPLLSAFTATMISACQTNIFVSASQNNSRQWARGTRNGKRSSTIPSASTGSPSHMESMRNASGG